MFTIKSTAFKDGETIPKKFTCDGQDYSPELSWENVPAGTKSFALICEDPDAPGGTFIKAGIVDETGNIVLEDSIPTEAEKGPSHVIEQISKNCEKTRPKFR